jgi:exodeoxyribonuclease V
MSLTAEQKDVIRQVVGNINSQQIQTLGGYAGTGKSTIIRVLLDAFEKKGISLAVAAFTGKATNVLRKKNIAANTIHSTIYCPEKDINTNETYWNLVSHYYLQSQNIHGFIIDEASMVSKEIHQDLVSFGYPIIYVGDHGQLEPIGTKFNLMENPMYRLETVHRNAGEIAHFAEHLRKGQSASTFQGHQKVQIVSESVVEDRHLASVDQIIVAFNKTRTQLNARVRKEKNIDGAYVCKGEKIICLRNNKKLGLFNGLQGTVTKVRKNEKLDFISDGMNFEYIKYDPDQFGQETSQFEFSQEPNPFDYAYAITCHKAQGDQFGNVIVYEQKCDKWDHIRWSYTAASRAVNGLIWIKSAEYKPFYLN